MSQIPQAAPYLSIDERKMLMEKQDWKAWLHLFFHLGIIVICFLWVFYFPSVVSVILAMLLLGSQQLAISVMMHDAGHFSMFSSKAVNDFVGNWFGAYPLLNSMYKYRHYHKSHHVHVGSAEDPDLMLTRGYPTNKRSMFRKFFRDLTGQTGIKAYYALFAMHLDILEYTQSGNIVVKPKEERETWKSFKTQLVGPIIANLILFLLLTFFLSPWLYLLWIGSLLTTFQVYVRIRSIAEHSVVDDPNDPNKNTRTTYANWFEKIFFAPYNVNYHLEHHMLMNVPFYNLPKMHKLLKARGFYEQGTLANGYWEILKLAGSSAERKRKFEGV